MLVICSLLFWNVLAIVLGKGDLRHYSSNKLFIDRLDPAQFEIVHPFQIRERNERIGIDTRNYFLNGTKHYEHATIVVRSTALGRIKLILDLNTVLLPNATHFAIYDNLGSRPPAYRFENCYYQGTVNGDSSTFVAISTCNGLRGVIAFENGSSYGIWPLEGGDRGRRHPHVLYQAQWKIDAVSGNTNTAQRRHTNHRRTKRDVTRQTKYVELAVLGDQYFMKQHNMSEEMAIAYAIEAINVADLMLSRYLNVRLSIVSFEGWLDEQRVDLHADTTRSLGGLVDYVTGHMFEQIKDATVLITSKRFNGHEMQAAAYASICTARAAALVAAVDVFSVQETGQSLAAAIGLVFGIDQDTGPCTCEMGSHCVMDRRIGWPEAPFTWQFSQCSIARMHGVLQSGHLQCLLNRPLQHCGNGVVDGDEQCDCGSRETCSDSCCDPLTCRLKAHAQCAAHHACCNQCKLRAKGEVCRASRSVCDVEEICTGSDGDCPVDAHLVDGSECGNSGQGQCWKGRCADTQAQCKKLWGIDSAVSDARCFARFNVLGVEHGNCGRGARDGGPPLIKCLEENVACGTLHCHRGQSATLDPTLDSFNSQFSQDGDHIQCKIVINSPLGMVEDGSSCGASNVCVQGVCVPLIQASSPVHCPSNNLALQCSGHGHCTTARECMCFEGWMGIACDTRSNATRRMLPATTSAPGDRGLLHFPSSFGDTPEMLGILLVVGLVLLLLLICLLFCYRRRTTTEYRGHGDKMSDVSIENNQRMIKFGHMPSYREEKRKRKRNKRVYDALHRINEASDERDSTSLNSSTRISAATDLADAVPPMSNGDLMRANGILKKEIAARIYEEDGIIYGHNRGTASEIGSPASRARLLDCSAKSDFCVIRNAGARDHRGGGSGYATDGELSGVLSARYVRSGTNGTISPCGSVASSGSRMQATPLKLNNIEMLLRQLNEGGGAAGCGGDEAAELSGVEADRGDLGSNTESSRDAPRLSPDHYELAALADFEARHGPRRTIVENGHHHTAYGKTKIPYGDSSFHMENSLQR